MKKTQIGTHLPITLHEIMKEICVARGLSPARDLHLIYREALEQYIENIDRSTGRPRKRSSWGKTFPSVLEEIGRSCRTDAELFLALDERPLMTWVAAMDHGCIFVNRELATYTGRTIDKLRGLNWLIALVHPQDRERLMSISSEAYAMQQASQIPYRIRRVDGVYVWIVDNACPRFHADGRCAGYVGTLYLIATELERAAPPKERDDPEGFQVISLPVGASKTDFVKGIAFQVAHHGILRKRL